MKNKKLKYEELEKKLAEAEKLIARLEKSRTTTISSKPDGAIKDTQELAQAYIASEQNFKNSMDASPLGIRIVTEDGALIYANKAILDICGYNTPQELAAVPRSQFYTPESYQAHLERKRKRKLKEYVPLEYEISIRRPDGEVRNLQVSRREVMWGGEQQFMGMYQDITEHKRAEQALRESEEKFHSIVEHGNDGIVFIQDGMIQYCNSKMLEIGGYTQRDVMGKAFIDFVAPEHKGIVFDIYSKRIAGKKAQERYELNIKGKDGRKVYTEVSASLITFKQNQVDIAIVRDITERKKVEEVLADESTRRRILIEQSRDGIVVLEQDGKVYEANQRFADMLGYSLEEAHKLHVFDWEFLYPKERVVEMIRTVDEKGDHFETQHRRKDGTTYDVEISTNGAMFAGQKLIFCVCRDITERKRAEKVILESEERFRTLFETMSQGVIYHDSEGRVISANPAAERILGLTLDEMIGKTSLDPRRRRLHEDGSAFASEDHPPIVALHTGKQVNDVIMAVYNPVEKDYRWIINSAIPEFREGEKKPYRVYTTFTDITERKRMEQALRESEEKFSKAFVSSPAIVAITTIKDGRYLDINDSYTKATGYSRKEIIGKQTTAIAIWANEKDRARMFRILKEQGRISKEEFDFRMKSGEIRTWLFSAEPIAIGGEECLIGVSVDITEHKRVEEELEKERQEINLILDSSPPLVWYKNIDGRFLRVNKAFAESLNMPAEDIEGKTVFDLFSADIAQSMTDDDREVLNSGRPKLNIVEQYEAAAGLRWVQTDKVPVLDKNGETQAIIGFAVDITERKQAEQRVNYLNQTLRSIRNVNQLITREKDRDKLLQGICNAFVQTRSFYMAWIVLFDESRHLITYAQSGMPNDFSLVVEAIKQGNLPSCVEKALKNKQVVIIEDPGKCVGCQMFEKSLDYSSMSVRLEYDGNVYGVLCGSLPREMLTDIDEPNLFEEVASDIAFALYNMERESDYRRLEQERLRAAKLESIGTLAGGIAHDFNNLLTGIMGNIGLVKTNISPSNASYEMLDEAEKAALRAKDLTQQLLTFARGGKPVKKSVNIAEIIRESAAFALRGSKAREELSLPDDLWTIDADEGQISQVINNLAINADEAMPAGGTLKIQAKNSTLKKTDIPFLPSGDYVRIDIADTGIGISPEHLQRIFEPYFTTKQRGSGLGLTTAYSIVRNHGGTILADSIQNKGSTFHIYLPATKKTMKGGKKMKAVSSGQAGGKVLVMDDEEIIRKMLNNMLSLAGYTVELSADGAEALEKYQQAKKAGDPFNAVIMDLTIPGGMGGKEAVQKLLEIDPQAKVIVSSGYATDPIMSEYKKYGFKAVIAKPYSVKQLQETLSGLLTAKKK
jgi:PAS domain S-box-containing protein